MTISLINRKKYIDIYARDLYYIVKDPNNNGIFQTFSFVNRLTGKKHLAGEADLNSQNSNFLIDQFERMINKILKRSETILRIYVDEEDMKKLRDILDSNRGRFIGF